MTGLVEAFDARTARYRAGANETLAWDPAATTMAGALANLTLAVCDTRDAFRPHVKWLGELVDRTVAAWHRWRRLP